MSRPPAPPRVPLPWIEQVRTASWALLLGICLVQICVSASQEPIAPNALGWRSTEGTVVETRFKVDGNGYVPEVEYRYLARGRTYTSTRIREKSVRFESQQEAEEWLEDYPVGQAVTVYHRNMFEGDSVLDRGHARLWTVFVLSIAGAIVGFLGLRHQLWRNAIAYRGGEPPRVFVRTPRPIRSAEPGEVRPARGFRRLLGRIARQRTPSYREFPKKIK